MPTELLATIYGLAAATCWGTGDFNGGFATKRGSVYSVILFSQGVGVIMLVALALYFGEPMLSLPRAIGSAAAGIFGTLALMALYQALSTGKMGVVAPVSALVGGVIPVIVGMLTEGFPTVPQFIGFAVALVAVWLISSTDEPFDASLRELRLPILAGIGFGLFFVLISAVSGDEVLMPVVIARSASFPVLLVIAMMAKQLKVPPANSLPFAILSGICDAGGNVFFLLATQVGRLDISAVLGSLYPAATVLLAWIILREQLTGQQRAGVAAAMGAIVLIAV